MVTVKGRKADQREHPKNECRPYDGEWNNAEKRWVWVLIFGTGCWVYRTSKIQRVTKKS